jgi:phage baseplate assembly protein W
MGGTGALTWSTTSPSNDLTVSAGGQVSTTGTLTLGAYFVAGTVVDAHGNSGVWQFSLTVVGAVSPGTGVTPVQPALPSGVEILVPFQIDPATGGVATLTDYGAIMAQHIETIILTGLNERVMNVGYGYGLERAVFQPINSNLPNLTAGDITTALTKWEPRVNILTVQIAQSPTAPNVLTVTVNFSVIPFNDVNTVSVSSGGTIAQVNASS